MTRKRIVISASALAAVSVIAALFSMFSEDEKELPVDTPRAMQTAAAVATPQLDIRKASIVPGSSDVRPPVIADTPAETAATLEETADPSFPPEPQQAPEETAAPDAAENSGQKDAASVRTARAEAGTNPRDARPTRVRNASDSAYQRMTGEDSTGLPISLARDEVQFGMNAVSSRVRKCSKKENRPIVMAVTISKNGTVADASATGTFAGTEIGECVARVVRTAVFPKSQRGVTVKYPFHL